MCGIPRFPRLVRGLWPDCNPLRRRSDRAGAALVTRPLRGAWLARRALERRDMAAWEADWLVTGARWTCRW
jgi:hypothetical protein